MIKGQKARSVAPFGPVAGGAARLPYAVELWNLPRTEPEKIVGRAASMVLARAIFSAAQTEHLGRKLVLRRGSRVVQECG